MEKRPRRSRLVESTDEARGQRGDAGMGVDGHRPAIP
jgi:hypothetical protein